MPDPDTVDVVVLRPLVDAIQEWMSTDCPAGHVWDQYVSPPTPPTPPGLVPWMYYSKRFRASRWVHDCIRSRPGYEDRFLCPGDAMILAMSRSLGRVVSFRLDEWRWSQSDGWEAVEDDE